MTDCSFSVHIRVCQTRSRLDEEFFFVRVQVIRPHGPSVFPIMHSSEIRLALLSIQDSSPIDARSLVIQDLLIMVHADRWTHLFKSLGLGIELVAQLGFQLFFTESVWQVCIVMKWRLPYPSSSRLTYRCPASGWDNQSY